MGYPTFKQGANEVVLEKGIIVPYSPEDLSINQKRGLTRGGSPYVTQFTDNTTRFMSVSIKNISEDNRTALYNFFLAIDYSVNNFLFFPKGVSATTGEGIFSDELFGSIFEKNITYDDEEFKVRLWQDNFNIPIVRGIGLGDLDELRLLILEELH